MPDGGNGMRRPRPRRRQSRGYNGTPRPQFADLEITDGVPSRSPGATPWRSFPAGGYVQHDDTQPIVQQPGQSPFLRPIGFENSFPPPLNTSFSPGRYVQQTGQSPLLRPTGFANPVPPGTYVPQWALGFGPAPAAASPWQTYNSGFLPPSPLGGPYRSPYWDDFAPLEDTDRLPTPLDIFPWADQGPFGGPQPVLASPWADALPPLMDPGFEPPFGFGEPITPMPMRFPPMTPGTPGPDLQPILFTRKYPYENENLAPRPSDWRRDYVPPRRFRLRFRLGGADKIKINLEHCHLSPLLLMPNSKMPIMSFDLRSDHPFDPLNLELLTTAGRPFNPTDLTQFATTRPVRRLRFYHPRIPWYIDVGASQPNGVLVGDVLQQIHEKLQRPIRPEDFSNTVLDATDREVITDAYRARCDDRVDIMQQGVRRVDFMGSDVILQGFMEGRNGMWLMKTTRFSRSIDG
ncbi:hypothetical protein DFH09DRAFT_973703 [Mycena vulgaris]|nr:hypothetical protein DFH09DRAFT_973703 [Mycena vulgaris]